MLFLLPLVEAESPLLSAQGSEQAFRMYLIAVQCSCLEGLVAQDAVSREAQSGLC